MKKPPQWSPWSLAALAALLASCATTATPAAAGGITGGSGQMIVINIGGEIKKDGSNAAPNSSTNSPTNETRATVPVNTGSNGLANTAGEIVRELVSKPRIDAEKTSPEAK